jgi:hypothetical protein
VTAPQQSPEAERRLDDLRRRLYRADVTDADVQQYLAQRGEPSDPETLLAPEPPPPPAPRFGRPAKVAAIAHAACAAVLGVRRAQPAEEPRPEPTQVLRDADGGPRFAIDLAGVSGPVTVRTSVRGTPVVGQQFEGHGSAVVPVDPSPGSFAGGRAMIVLTAAQSAPTEWRAVRLITRNDWTSYPVVLAHGSADPGMIVATPSTFVYPGAPPARIAVDVPEGIRWTLVVAATDGLGPSVR